MWWLTPLQNCLGVSLTSVKRYSFSHSSWSHNWLLRFSHSISGGPSEILVLQPPWPLEQRSLHLQGISLLGSSSRRPERLHSPSPEPLTRWNEMENQSGHPGKDPPSQGRQVETSSGWSPIGCCIQILDVTSRWHWPPIRKKRGPQFNFNVILRCWPHIHRTGI